ncbi:hypothetical protein SH467x_003024 [Pirellulaceae bacterium SH467]
MCYRFVILFVIAIIGNIELDALPSSDGTESSRVVVLVASKAQATGNSDVSGEMIVLREDRDQCTWTYLNRFGRLSSGSFKCAKVDQLFSGLVDTVETLAQGTISEDVSYVGITVICGKSESVLITKNAIKGLLENPLIHDALASIEAHRKSGKSLVFFDDLLWSNSEFIREGRPVKNK